MSFLSGLTQLHSFLAFSLESLNWYGNITQFSVSLKYIYNYSPLISLSHGFIIQTVLLNNKYNFPISVLIYPIFQSLRT
jgi:hypothetical protein